MISSIANEKIIAVKRSHRETLYNDTVVKVILSGVINRKKDQILS